MSKHEKHVRRERKKTEAAGRGRSVVKQHSKKDPSLVARLHGCTLASAVALMAFLSMGSPTLGGPVVFEQLPDSSRILGAGFSQSGLIRRADNFTLVSDQDIADFHWWGLVANTPVLDLSIVSDFTVGIWADDGSGTKPTAGSPIYFETLVTAATNPVPTGNTSPQGHIEYFHSVDLVTPVSLSGGVQYWFSVAAELTAGGNWGWRFSDDGDGVQAAQFLPNDTWNPFPGDDQAFQLTAVPEPGSLALLALGALGVARRRRSA